MAVNNSFELIALEWHEHKKPSWSKGYATDILEYLKKDIFPHIGKRPIADINAKEMLDVFLKMEKRGVLDKLKKTRQACRQFFIYAVISGRAEHNPVSDLLFSKKPQNFPWYDEEKKVKYSNALCLLFEGQLCKKTSNHLAPLFRPTAQFFRCDIDAFASLKGTTNLFKRHGYINEDGRPYSIRTHQLRHLLNTFAQINGMDEFSIARWSGRKLVSQNVSYDHRSHLQMIKLIKDKTLIGAGNSHRKKEIAVMDITYFDSLNSGAVLITKHGYCKHSYAFDPCGYYLIQDSTKDDERLIVIHKKLLK